MKLEEAIERLKKYLSDIEKMGYRKLPNDEAIETILQEIERLQIENEELRIERDGYRTQLNSAFDNGFIHKDKIREKIEEYRNKEYITEMCALKDLLKEE